jgi:hypothetical protein
MNSTPDRIVSLSANQVFVFGSNYAGRHGRGAAKTAVQKFGARNGQGTGLMGRSYGIATKDRKLKTLPLHSIEIQIDSFLRFALSRPELQFLVTKIGCGLAGYSEKQISSLFQGKPIPPNVILPQSFQQ